MSIASVGESPKSRILIIEDDEGVARLLVHALKRLRHEVERVASGPGALEALSCEPFDLVLLDLNLPGMGGIEVLAAGRAMQPDAQFVVLTGYGTVDSAVEAMKLGAFDYLSKPIGIDGLSLVVDRALRERELGRAVPQRPAAGVERRRLIGASPQVQRVRDQIERLAPTRATVLITGETGTGKELVAREIHDRSDRAAGPFVPIRCSALPQAPFGTGPFRQTEGAGPGPPLASRGLFEEAHGGTLYLDEIATLSSAFQVELLRVLQERRTRRDGDAPPGAVDFRLVAATDRDLGQEVEAGRFREDLLYRLGLVSVDLPPLRERRGDIPVLAHHFRLRCAREHGVRPPEIGRDAMRRLVEHGWPGNVRELESFIERSVIMHASLSSLPFQARPPAAGEAAGGGSTRPTGG